MRTDNALHNGQGETWQLLLQFVAAEGLAGERETVQRIAEEVQKLGLPPRQTEQIGQAVIQAVRKATKGGHRDQPEQPVAVRIWVSDGDPKERSRSNSSGKESSRQTRRGWGFFIIQRQKGGPQATTKGAHHLLDLFLYQEGEHARRDRRSPPA